MLYNITMHFTSYKYQTSLLCRVAWQQQLMCRLRICIISSEFGKSLCCLTRKSSEEHGLLLPREESIRWGWHGLQVDLGGGGHSMTICPHKKCTLEITFLKTESKLYFPLTSPTALVRIWMILSCGVATTLCVLISMMRWPTRMPPRSAMPPRIRLQICNREENKHKKQTQRKERFLFCQRTNSNERRSSCEDEHRGTREAGLTMPSSTLKPSWNLGSGLLMIAMVTGGQCTMLSFTYFWLLRSWDGNEMRIGKLTCRHISVALTLYHL